VLFRDSRATGDDGRGDREAQSETVGYDEAAFGDLQSRLVEWWPVLTVRTIPDRPRVLVCIPSVTLDLPPTLQPLLPAYEERYLAYCMMLARAEHTRLV
jgi:hypothetical protein